MTLHRSNTITPRRCLPMMWLGFVLLAVLLSFVLSMPSRPAAAQAATSGDVIWHVIDASGDVRVRSAGTPSTPWRGLTAGETVSANAELEAGKDGKAVLSHEGSRITISSNSQLTLPDRVPSGAVYRVVQRAGTMLFKIVHATKDKFQVQTPYLTTVIKGTTFSVTVNGAGGSVHVTEGAVLVQPLSGEAAMVSPGQTARVPAGSRGGVIINGRNGNGGGNGGTTVPATDTAQKSNEPSSPQGDKQPAARQAAAIDISKTQDASKGGAKPTGTRMVTIVFDDGKGKMVDDRGRNDGGPDHDGKGDGRASSDGSKSNGKANNSKGNSFSGGGSDNIDAHANADGAAAGALGPVASGGGYSPVGGSSGFSGGSGGANIGGGALGATPAALGGSGGNSGNGNSYGNSNNPGSSGGALGGNGNQGNGKAKGKKK